MNDSLVHQATLPPDIETDHTAYFNQLSGYLGMIFILTLLNSYVGFLVIMKTERWQQPWLVKWREKLTGREKGVFIFIPIITIIFLYFLIYLNFTITLLKWVLALLLIVLHACILLCPMPQFPFYSSFVFLLLLILWYNVFVSYHNFYLLKRM